MKTFIIAEAGVNHNGCIDTALKLVDAAKNSGADAVKFQTFKAEQLVTSYAKKAEYQIKNTSSDDMQKQMLKKLELSDKMHSELIGYCQEKDIEFMSTAFDLNSLNYLIEKGVSRLKIPSGEITNLPLLEQVARQNLHTIVSTGMCSIGEIDDCLKVLTTTGLSKNKIVVLHCNTEYPTPYVDVNLNAMKNIGAIMGVKYGYSDHTLGIEVPIAAVALGATVIEKHLTLDRCDEGPDHKASLEPTDFRQMVSSIRNIEFSLGDGTKNITQSERKNVLIARKSIVASCDIEPGEIFSNTNLTAKRPATGINPMRWYDVLGKIAKRRFKKDELIVL